MQQFVSKLRHIWGCEWLTFEDNLLFAFSVLLEIFGHIHPADLAIRAATCKHHREGRVKPVLDMIWILDYEYLFAIEFYLISVIVASLELQVDLMAAGLSAIVFNSIFPSMS